ncbi:glycosyltransferase [Alteromonas abrolhosensis]|uniref:glycosyltransferase n=1 Tax=Alteromonas abrolhosensis TaxID=1892904 RepID=UPI003515F828
MKKIVFLINSIKLGGAERALVNLLSKPTFYEGFDVSVLLLDDEPLAREVPDHIKLVKLDSGGSLLKSVINLKEYLKRNSPDLVVSFLVRSNVANAFLRWFGAHSKAVLCERMHLSSHLDNQFSGLKRRIASLPPTLFYRFADAAIGVSTGVTNDLITNFSMPKEKAFTIFNPYNTEEILTKAKAPSEVTIPPEFIISTGRLTPAKNFKHLIDAYLASNEFAPLCILGEGAQKQELLEFIQQRGASEKVLLLGYAKNPFPILAKAKYYISASTNEGFPNALVEAMVVGLPVIMTNCPSGPAEILEENEVFNSETMYIGKHGILVPLNKQSELTAAMNYLQDNERRKVYSVKSIRRANDFHINNIARDYWRFLNTVLQN